MSTVSRWIAPAVLAAGLGLAVLSPTTAHAQSGDDLVRVIVDVADVVLRGGTPYYRNSDYGYNDRLTVERDRYGRPVYYRQVANNYRNAPPYGNAYGYRRNVDNRQVKCNKHGKCKTTYYDARHDRDGRRYDNRYDNRYYSYDRDDRNRRDRDDHHDHD
ncbi:MAG: hypothetical protein ACYC42_04635 [Lysobacter sp.]